MSDLDDQALREHLVYLLRGGGAHVSFAEALEVLPPELRGARPEGVPYTPWRLIEHIRLCQWDILDFSRNPDYETASYPEGFWPEGTAPPDEEAWARSVAQFEADNRAMCQLVSDPGTDLFAAIPHGEGQTILREAMLIPDHNAYHIGQIITVRRLLGAFETDSRAPDNL